MNATATWHRPLLWLAAAMGVLAVVATIGAIVDPREVLGTNLWFKPLKFAISIAIYSVSLSWLLSLLQRRKRFFWTLGTVTVVGLVAEIVIIVVAAALGGTSHFNVATPFNTAMWTVMAASITVVWAIVFMVSIALFRADLGDRARTVAIRGGALVAVVGMGLAFLMTGPTAQQLDDFQGIAGAHTVGLADGGPGLPILGWSTESGDLRIPHFIGMHALQVLPLVVIALELLARRWPRLDAVRRLRLVWIATAAYAAVLALVTVQALAGESIAQPSGLTLLVGSAIAVLTAAGVSAALLARTTSEFAALTPR